MYGPPGTGKTLCARAVANRTDACFIRVIGSELVQKYVGEGARMVRELFEMARSKKVCAFLSWFLERILEGDIIIKYSLESKLNVYLICLIRIVSLVQDIFRKQLY